MKRYRSILIGVLIILCLAAVYFFFFNKEKLNKFQENSEEPLKNTKRDTVLTPTNLVKAIRLELAVREYKSFIEANISFTDTTNIEQWVNENYDVKILTDSSLNTYNENPLFDEKSSKELFMMLVKLVDNRQEYYMAQKKKIQDNFRKVAIAVPKNLIDEEIVMGRTYSERPIKYNGKLYKGCASQFKNQKSFGVFTAFPISENHLLTICHGFSKDYLMNHLYIFDAFIPALDKQRITTKEENIFIAKDAECVFYDKTSGLDYAIIRVNKKIPNFRIPELEIDYDFKKGEDYYTIGSSEGLPLKYVTDGYFQNYNGNNLIDLKMNIFRGNSGSPLFKDNKVVAMITSGQDNTELDNECIVEGCLPIGCSGEYALKLSSIPEVMELSED